MSFIIMQLSLTYYSLGVTISFCKFWFENDTLIQVRYCHLLGIWCVFIVDMLISSFFLILHDKIYVDIYLKIFRCILVLRQTIKCGLTLELVRVMIITSSYKFLFKVKALGLSLELDHSVFCILF